MRKRVPQWVKDPRNEDNNDKYFHGSDHSMPKQFTRQWYIIILQNRAKDNAICREDNAILV